MSLVKEIVYDNPRIIHSYRDLAVWRKGIALVKAVYKITEKFPSRENYGLAAQLQRAAVSIPSNLAEGSSRRSTREFIRFINMALGSVAEVETQIIVAQELAYVDGNDAQEVFILTEDINKMLSGLYKSLTAKLKTQNSKLTADV